MVGRLGAMPNLIDYVQLPLHLWIPDFFYPQLVPSMPCPQRNCKEATRRLRWKSGGPRLIHGVNSSLYLHCWEYACHNEEHPSFNGFHSRSLGKLPVEVQHSFRYHLTAEEGVTDDLMREIAGARMSGSSLQGLQQKLNAARYDRMYQWQSAYYHACSSHKLWNSKGSNGKGEAVSYPHFPPLLTTENAYCDHAAPSIDTLRQLYDGNCERSSDLWMQHTQQHTAKRVSVDATFKIAAKVHNRDSPFRMLWTMVDIDTGVICSQQMLTHERSEDVLPMLQGYVARCKELRKPLPVRVSSDRGSRDSALINHETAFPNAHINVDNWHFQQRFLKTLNKKSPVFQQCHTAFSRAVYKQVTFPDGTSGKTHADPDSIIRDVSVILETYSVGGEHGAAVTKATKDWWKQQIPDIWDRRILSNPVGVSDTDAGTVSSSRQESYHSQLNRRTRFVTTSAQHMHWTLMQFMFRWNTERRRKSELEADWGTFDLPLVISAFKAAALVLSVDGAVKLFGNSSPVPRPISCEEQFGLIHSNVTLKLQTDAADQPIPFNDELVQEVIASLSADLSLFTKAVTEAVARVSEASSDSSTALPDDPPAAAIEKVAEAVFEHASRITSAQWISQHGSVSTAAYRLTHVEKQLLRGLLRNDQQLVAMCNDKKWELAAARWNSFVGIFNDHPQVPVAVRCARPLTEDTMRNAVKAARSASVREAEQQNIHLSTTLPGIPYVEVSARKIPFTPDEDELLLELAKKYPKKGDSMRGGDVRWKDLKSAWRVRWIAAVEIGGAQHHPRSVKQLHNRYTYIRKVSNKSTVPPAYSQSQQQNAQQQAAMITLTSGPSVETLDGTSTIVSVEAGGVNASAGAVSDAAAAAAEIVPSSTSVTSRKRKYDKWTFESGAEFTRLYNLYGGKLWTFNDFLSVWDADTYGEVERDRWKIRSQTESRRAARTVEGKKKQRTNVE
jgi:hypothetical protein